VEDFELLDRWGDKSVYRDKRGHKIPERIEAMFAMSHYKALAIERKSSIKSGQKQEYDIG
jgi:hypothetical protein